MSPFLTLDREETPTDPEFTRHQPHHSDLTTLGYLTRRLRSVLAQGILPPGRQGLEEPSGREHTVLVAQPRALASSEPLTLVGFFGQRNPAASQADRQALWDIDDQLVAEVAEHPGILSLSCLELPDGNYANLVVLASLEAADHWRTSPTHRRAVEVHSPRYYSSIRIHNGTLFSDRIAIHRTKYYEFRTPRPWFAAREWDPSPLLHQYN